MSRFPRAYRQALLANDMRNVDRAVRHATGSTTATITTHSRATLPGDRRRLRGIPVVGGVGGTSPGTDPHHETCRRMGIR